MDDNISVLNTFLTTNAERTHFIEKIHL